ncbi:MAG: hypothetical protein E7537_06585 [Ruminococcaceae bacterium]|nr:hypothetical protein [Oscillospiraceae bacterium]
MSIIYIIAAFASLLALVSYSFFIKEKISWFWVLFVAIFVVNIGYFLLSISDTLTTALNANRLSYLGSVILPFAMLMIILNASHLTYPKWLWLPLAVLSVPIFLVTASPGYLDIYYKKVTLITVNGVSILNKTYGNWHKLYMLYLIIYFITMIAVVLYATLKKKLTSTTQVIMLLGAVFVNICVWAIEQFINIEFEFLSISYIITELFLIGVYALVQETENRILLTQGQNHNKNTLNQLQPASVDFFLQGVSTLTYTEKLIYDLYIEGKSTQEVLSQMNIKENTLKYHNKNIYSKLGVSSRKQLKEFAKFILPPSK